MHLARTRGLVIAALLILSICGCGDKSAESADAATGLYQQGLLELYRSLADAPMDEAPWEWHADVSEALRLFEAALDEDPDHCGALLASAVTRALSVLTDAELAAILDELFPREDRVAPGPMLWHLGAPNVRGAIESVMGDRPGFDFQKLQDYIEEEAVPNLDLADLRLRRFEELACAVELVWVVPTVPPAVPEVVRYDIDLADAFFVHSSLDALQATAHGLCAYELDAEDGQTLEELIEEDAGFLVLRSGDHTVSAYGELEELAAHLAEAASELDAETDPQEDDVVTLDGGLVSLEACLGPDPLQRLELMAAALADGLAGGVSVNPSEMEPADPAAPDLDIVIDLSELLLDPLEDLRDYLPAHTWPTPDSMHILRPINMPDPTLDNITPGMTNEAWEEVTSWLAGKAP